MNKATLILSLLLFITLPILSHSASVPPLINYQGLLTDAQGQPVIFGTNKLTFNIYDAVIGGNLIWGPQVFDSVPVINGMFNVILGTTDTGGRSILDAFDAETRFLGIIIDNGSEISPRQQILSTPYAVKAGHHSNIIPPGTIVPFGGDISTPPEGWLICDGSEKLRVDYAELFAVIGTAWGAGDGSTSFNLPDTRGRFLRGIDSGSGNDPDAASRTANAAGGNTGDNVGSVQGDEFKSHNHQNGEFTLLAKTTTVKVMQYLVPDNGNGYPGHHASERGTIVNNGGTETRSKNAAVNYIIKY